MLFRVHSFTPFAKREIANLIVFSFRSGTQQAPFGYYPSLPPCLLIWLIHIVYCTRNLILICNSGLYFIVLFSSVRGLILIDAAKLSNLFYTCK